MKGLRLLGQGPFGRRLLVLSLRLLPPRDHPVAGGGANQSQSKNQLDAVSSTAKAVGRGSSRGLPLAPLPGWSGASAASVARALAQLTRLRELAGWPILALAEPGPKVL